MLQLFWKISNCFGIDYKDFGNDSYLFGNDFKLVPNYLENFQFLWNSFQIFWNWFQLFWKVNTMTPSQNDLVVKNFLRFGWVIDISNNFSWGFQKCQFYHRRSYLVDNLTLPTQRTYRLGYRLRGQSWHVERFSLIKKSRRVLLLELKN